MIAGRTGQALGVRVVERQRVQGQMVRVDVQCGVERRHPRSQISIRDVVQQVDVDRADARRARRRDGVADMPGAMATAELAQLVSSSDCAPKEMRVMPARRHAAGSPRSSGPGLASSVISAPSALSNRSRTRASNRRCRRLPAGMVSRLPGTPSRGPVGPRYPTAECPVERIGTQVDLGQDRGEVLRDPVARATSRGPGDDHEIAVRTERDAEGNVDIERDGGASRGAVATMPSAGRALTDLVRPTPAS